jgi:hypothetical protein
MATGEAAVGWSLRATGRYTGLSVFTVRTLVRVDPDGKHEGDLSPVDVLCVKVLGELGANRSVNRDTKDERAVRLQDRDQQVLALLRSAATDRLLDASVRLIATDSDARLVRQDYEILAALADNPGQTLHVMSVGAWFADITAADRAIQTEAAARAARKSTQAAS